MTKTIISFLMTAAMALSFFNCPVYAEDETTDEPAEEIVLQEEETDNDDTDEVVTEQQTENTEDSDISEGEETETTEEEITDDTEQTESSDEEPVPEEENIENAPADVEDNTDNTEIIEDAEEEQELMYKSVQLGAVGYITVDDSGEDPGLSGTNIDQNDYYTYGKPVYSNITKTDDGFMLVDCHKNVLKALYYSDDYVLQKTVTLNGQLPLFGGFYETDSNYYIVTGQNNLDESADVECYRITKYDKNWNEIGSVGLYDCNTYIPFDAGSCRMADSGNYLLVHTCHEMYKSDDGYHHQANVTIQVNTDTMTISKAYYSVMNISVGYVSHSFNEFVTVDNEYMVTLDHGDAYPRGLVIAKYRSKVSSGTFSYISAYNTFLKFAGETGSNYTNASVGGFEMSSTHFLTAGASGHQQADTEKTRNIFVAAVSRDDLSNSSINWLTSYEEDGTRHVTTPLLTDVGNDRYLVLWSESDGNTHAWNNLSTLHYVLVDNTGNLLTEIHTMPGLISDCTPTVKDNKAVWYAHRNNDVIFYEIDLTSAEMSQHYAKTQGWIETQAIKLSESSFTLCGNQSFTLSTEFVPENASDQIYSYSVSDSSIVSVSSNGKVTAKSEGTATITAETRTGQSAQCEVTVLPAITNVSSYTLSSKLYVGSEYNWTYTFSPSSLNQYVKYSCSDPTVATISSDGVIKVLKPGTATVTVQLGTYKREATFTAENVKVTRVMLSRYSMTLDVDTVNSLTATVYPTNATDKSVSWSSSDSSVATVDQEGNVTAKNSGTAKITVRTNDGGFEANCTVTVVVPAKEIRLDQTEFEVPIGTYYNIPYTILPENTTNKTLTCKAEDTSIVRTYNNGKVYGLKSGQTTVTLTTNNGITAQCVIRVTNPAKSVRLNYSSRSMIKGNTFQLTATVTPSDADDKSVTWESSDEDVAAVSQDGLVTAKKSGTAVITVKTVNGLKAVCNITVTNPATGISFDETSGTLAVGHNITLKTTLTPSDADETALTWSSSNTAVATVEDGKVTAIKKGAARITVRTANGKTAVYTLTVNNPVTDITLDQISGSLKKDETIQLHATITPADADNRTLTWTSSDSTVASVSTSGLVTAKKTGTATITAKTANGISATYTVTVTNPATAISLSSTEISLEEKKTFKLTAEISPADADEQDLTWSSSNTSIVKVDNNGEITAVKKGSATITAKLSNGLQAQCDVTVIAAPTGVKLSKTGTEIIIGNTEKLTAETLPERIENYAFTWTSDSSDIAEVSQQGIVTAKKIGKTIVTVSTAGGLKETCNVRVLFTDVTSPNQYYYDAVYWAVEKNITQGMGPTTFNPGGFCKRYQFVLFLWRQAGCPEPELTEDPFTDVLSDPKKDVYEKAVLWAVDKEITTGTTPTTFDPYAPLTRGQVVTFLYRAAGKPEVSTTTNPFKDLDSSKYYYKAVLWAVENGITTGVKPDQFQPTVTCTRGQTVLFMYRMFN